jgi:hypothetical protein
MSRYDYEVSKAIERGDPPFAALIMAALRKADTGNARLLWTAWPDICRELQERYDAPGGVLPSDPDAAPPAPSGSRERGCNGPQEGGD